MPTFPQFFSYRQGTNTIQNKFTLQRQDHVFSFEKWVLSDYTHTAEENETYSWCQVGKIILYAAKIVVQYHFNGLKMQKKSENIFSSKQKTSNHCWLYFKDYKVLSLLNKVNMANANLYQCV